MIRRKLIPMDGIECKNADSELDFIHEMWRSLGTKVSGFTEKVFSEKYLAEYLLENHNDVCLIDEVGYIPNINTEIIGNNPNKSIVQLFEIDKIQHEFDMSLDEYVAENISYEHKKIKLSEERTNIIKKMYDYSASEARVTTVPSTKEEIGNWYMVGFPTIEELEEIFNIEDLYDLDIDFKIEVANIDESSYFNDGKGYLKTVEYFKKYIDLYGISNLDNEEYCVGIIITILIDMDWNKQHDYSMYSLIMHKVNGGIYIALAIELYHKTYQKIINILINNYKKAMTDDQVGVRDLENKREALNVSLRMIKNILDIDKSLKGEFDRIFKNLEYRINDNSTVLSTFIRTMKNANMNYMLSAEDGTLFYPYFVDMVLDIYRFKYLVKDDKYRIDLLKGATSVFGSSKYVNELNDARSSFLSNKIQILDKIKRDQIENYLLHLYVETLPSNRGSVKSFYKQVLFSVGEMKNKSNTFSTELDLKKVPTNISIRYYSRLIK